MLATKVRVQGTAIRWALDFVNCVLASAWLSLQQSRNLGPIPFSLALYKTRTVIPKSQRVLKVV